MSSDDFDDNPDNVINMPQRDGQESEPAEGVNRYADQLSFGLSVIAEGTSAREIIAIAKERAAQTLRMPVEHLYVMSHGAMNLHTESRFEDPPRPTTWTMRVSIGVIPESAREPEPEPPPKGGDAPRKRARKAKP